MIDSKYHLFPVFLYIKTRLQRTVVFELNDEVHVYGYHNDELIDLIVDDPTEYDTAIPEELQSLWEEFVKIRDENPNLIFSDLIKITCINDLPNEIIALIAKEVELKDLHSFCLSGKKFWKSSTEFMKEMKKRYNNELRKIIRAYPNADWSWLLLSFNPNIDIHIVLEHKDKKWDWNLLSGNSGINFQDIIAHPELPWNWKGVSFNPNVTTEIINKHLGLTWDWNSIAININIDMDFILKHSNKKWDWNGLAQIVPLSIPLDSRLQLSDLSYNKSLTPEIIDTYPDVDWNWGVISRNKNLTNQFVLNHKDELHFRDLSSHYNIDFILDNPKLPWDWSEVSQNPNVNLEIIKKYFPNRWNFNLLSSNPNMTLKFVIDNPNPRWNWFMLMGNPNILPEQLVPYLWKYNNKYLFSNPNMTLKFIKDHPDIIVDWDRISRNKFNYKK